MTDILYPILARLNSSPSQLVYNRRVQKSDRSGKSGVYAEERDDPEYDREDEAFAGFLDDEKRKGARLDERI